MINVGIVIVCHNNLYYTKQCIDSVLRYTDVKYRLYLVNNGCQDGTQAYFEDLKARGESVRIVESATNLGFAGGNNLAFKTILEDADCTHVLLLNNDIIARPRYLSSMLNIFSLESKAGAVGPMSNYVGGRQLAPDLHVDSVNYPEVSQLWEDTHRGRYFSIGRIVGLCLLLKIEVLTRVGLLDERFRLGMWEDSDYSLRLSAAGYGQYIAEDVLIYHFGSKTINMLADGRSLFLENRKLFIDKWKEINRIGEHKRVVGMLRVRNGGEILRATLEKHSRICDEIVVFDDHSTDNTEEICRSFPRVVEYRKSVHGNFDEARDRNEVFQMAASRNPQWIFSIDHDEVPEDRLIRDIQKLVNDPDPEIKLYCFKICHLWASGDENVSQCNSYRVDGLWGGFWQGRLFKYEQGQEIRGSEDGLHCGSTPSFSTENTKLVPYRIKHYGNLVPADRLRKYFQYTRTDRNKDVNAILGGWQGWYTGLYKRLKELETGTELESYTLSDKDFYRHIVNEATLQRVEWSDDLRISLPMIVRNEEEYLDRALSSVVDLVDEIVVVDTGSTDRTLDIARKYTDKIYKYEWNDSFADARNYARSLCTGSWIFRLDGDEELPEGKAQELRQLVMDNQMDVILFTIRNYIEDPKKKDKASYTTSQTVRLFRNLPEIVFTGRVHEELDESIDALSKIRNVCIGVAATPLYHYGYLKSQSVLTDKYEYYANLSLRGIREDPKNYRSYFNLAGHYYHTDRLEEAEMMYRKTLELNPNQFMAWHDLGMIVYKRAISRIEADLKEAASCYQKCKECMTEITEPRQVEQHRINSSIVEMLLNGLNKERSRC